ncbi:DUF2335 domain-containing protein [Halomonas sp. BC1]|uniref:DUF2335 domain-containing protein n=1 Tax=Halomonas sp. BC1 TaxID=1670448 RepID=UPI0009C18318|nr:DUF2335 domain-containing protein [Halomonas sp. BC1]
MTDSPDSHTRDSSQQSPASSNNQSIIAQQLTYSGPLPPSAEMEKYERISPGAADRILAMAEKEQAHRHEQEEKENAVNSRIAESNIRSQDASISEIKRGQWMAYSLGLIFLGITVMLGLSGHEVAASTLGLGGVAAVATVFIKVRNKQ